MKVSIMDARIEELKDFIESTISKKPHQGFKPERLQHFRKADLKKPSKWMAL